MKKLPLFLLMASVAILSGVVGYLLGIVKTGLKTAVDSNTANVMWITGIHGLIRAGNIEKADRLCFTAASGNFEVLNRLREHPSWIIINALPWLHLQDKANETTLDKAKAFYAPHASKLSPESNAFLEGIKESPRPPSL